MEYEILKNHFQTFFSPAELTSELGYSRKGITELEKVLLACSLPVCYLLF